MARFKIEHKTAKTEFNESMLPHNRKQIFFDVLKLHFFKLLLLGLITFLFCAPLTASIIFEDNAVLNILNEAADAASEETLLKILSAHNLFTLIQFPLVIIAFLGIAFNLRFIRQYAWEENIDFGYDLRTGFKQNFKETTLLALIVALIYCLCRFGINQAYDTKSAISYLLYVPTGFTVIIITPIVLHTLVAIPVYGNGFFGKIKIGAFTFLRSAPKTLLATLCVAIIFVPFMVPNIIAHFAGAVVTPILFPFALLAFTLFSYNQLDRYVNPNSHPELIGRGITKIEEN